MPMSYKESCLVDGLVPWCADSRPQVGLRVHLDAVATIFIAGKELTRSEQNYRS